MGYLLLVLAALVSAFQVVRARGLLMSTLWLAVTSACVSILLYLLGGYQVAVIELSVGAGLVTILFVFAFSMVGEHALDQVSLVPRPLVSGLVLATAFLLGWFTFPLTGLEGSPGITGSFAQVLWQQRGLDVLAQIVLIFGAVLGLLGLLGETQEAPSAHTESSWGQQLPSQNGHYTAQEKELEEVKA